MASNIINIKIIFITQLRNTFILFIIYIMLSNEVDGTNSGGGQYENKHFKPLFECLSSFQLLFSFP